MSETNGQSGKHEGRLPHKDITPVLKGWDYESGTINVRKITGIDGEPKLQMRLDLGLLQMEMSGRPDGQRPHGHESLLDYFESQLREHEKCNGTELGFHLTGSQCQSLREEAVMYYHRYLSLFVLEEYPGVVRDTARNLRLLDLCGRGLSFFTATGSASAPPGSGENLFVGEVMPALRKELAGKREMA